MQISGRYVSVLILSLVALLIPGTAVALMINGPDEVSIDNPSSFTVDGYSGDSVKWSVTGNTGTDGGISGSGALSTSTNACGVLTVTASIKGKAVTKDVRVANNSKWSYGGDICSIPGSYTQHCYDTIEIGRYKYSSSFDRVGPEYCQPLSRDRCGNLFCKKTSYSEYGCKTMSQNVDDDGDGYNAYGSPGGPPYDPNDNDPSIYPDAPEKCGDGIDNNGDGAVDEGCKPGPSPNPGCSVNMTDNGACLPTLDNEGNEGISAGRCELARLVLTDEMFGLPEELYMPNASGALEAVSVRGDR